MTATENWALEELLCTALASCMEQKTSGRGWEGCVLKIVPSSVVFESEVWQIAL